MHGQPTGHDGDGKNRPGPLSFAYSRRLFLLLGVAIVVALTVRALLVPEGFGKTGHYRADAPAEEAARAPVHQGAARCAECHDEQSTRHDKDVHVSVACENCHGAGDRHVAAQEGAGPADDDRMFRDLAPANCLACHARLVARPKLFPTIEVAAHYALVGVKDRDTRCQACHDPHEPLFLERRVSEARLHPLIHPCSDCHADPVEGRALPDGHVATFQCGDCHAALQADFESKAHKDLDCRTCHPFRRDSDFSGRIFKNGNPRFCLMCHQDKPFKDAGRIPLLASAAAHIDEMASSDEERARRCADCHRQDHIHGLQQRAEVK